jgi:hypothetical protein
MRAPAPLLLHILPFLLATERRTSQPPASSRELIVYQVCLSPGCVADGAEDTLERFQAMAPPHIIIEAGVCSSLCGNGPVVLMNPPEHGDAAMKKKTPAVRHRKVKGDKILELLCAPPPTDHRSRVEEVPVPVVNPLNDVQAMRASLIATSKPVVKACSTAPPDGLVQGYNVAMDADALFLKKSYEDALKLYQQAVQLAFRPAIDLQNSREVLQRRLKLNTSRSTNKRSTPPPALVWLIRARRNEAICNLRLHLLDDAMLAATAACNLSRNTDADCFQVLAEIYQTKGDSAGELQALQSSFGFPVDESCLSMQQKNQRRLMRLRLAKLERLVE